MKAYAVRIATHIALMATWFAVIIARVAPVVVVVVLVVTSFGLAAAWMALAATNVAPVAAGTILVIAKVLEQFLE